MKKIHVYSSIDENFNKPQALQSAVSFGMIPLQSQKTIASRGKLNLYKAHSTPKACFFMRNIRTSQELADFVLFNLIILSMVGRNRQPFAVGCLPCMAVFHPVTSYRPTVESLAVVSENLYKEITQMYQFIFAAIRRTDLTNHIVKIRINADTEQEARKPLAREFVFVLAGRINLQNTVKTDRTFLTNGNNHSLPTVKNVAMISPQSQKTIASREKLTLLQAHSTPKACFFMRNIRTSQELADFVLFNLIILSMVGRNRQPFAVGCLPCMAVFHPVTSYRPTVESLAVVSENLYKEITQMYQFIFAAIRRTDLTNHIVKIRINADTEQEARKPLAREFVFVLAGRINLQNTVKTDRTFLTNGNNHSLPTVKNVAMISPQSQKTIAEPANSTYLQLAHSTPEACFFMRNIRTPKEFADFVFIHQIYKFLSMVACSGKGPSFAVFQLSQFCRPLHVTAKACKLSAVALKCLQLELLAMIYLFNAIKRMDFNNTELNIHTFPKSIIRVRAESLEQAKGLLSRDYFVINTGRINLRATKNLVNDTFNQGLSANKNACSIVGTTTKNGNRTRKTCGFFTSQIPIIQSPENSGDSAYIEFAARLRDRTKALSTNKIRRFFAVVDTLSHPTGDISQNTKQREPTMKIYPQNNRTLATFPALSVSAEMEVAHG